MKKKLIFIPGFILNFYPEFQEYKCFEGLFLFNEDIKNKIKNIPKLFEELDNSELDKNYLESIGFDKYKDFINVESFKKIMNIEMKKINPSLQKYINSDEDKGIVYLDNLSFIISFIDNAYLIDDFQSYLIDEHLVNEDNATSHKLFFQSRFKYDYLGSLMNYLTNNVEYSRNKYNQFLIKRNKGRTPKGFKEVSQMAIKDFMIRLEDAKFYLNREIRELDTRIDKIEPINEKATKILNKLKSNIEKTINSIDTNLKYLNEDILKKSNRNNFEIITKLIPNKLKLRAKVGIDSLEGEMELEKK